MGTEKAYPKIRMGTLVRGDLPDIPGYIAQLLPYGFESFQLFFWQTLHGVDLPRLANELNELLDGEDAIISSLGIFGNPLETEEVDLKSLEGWQQCIEYAHLFGADIVAGFTGRLRGKPVPDSLDRFKEIFSPLADQAEKNDVRIAFENCDMNGNWLTGDWNIAHNPIAWELMFDAVPSKRLGLEWEPCHQLVNLIDPMPQLPEWMPRIYHVHGKDATVKWDVVHKYGVGGAKPFAFHRTPGFGDSNWTDIISELRVGGYEGSIDIEGWHDPAYHGELEITSQVHGLNYLKHCRGGDYIPNPS